jgi:Na+/glutamate symporter
MDNLGRHPTTLMDHVAHRRTSPVAHLDETYVLSVETSELVGNAALDTYVCVGYLCQSLRLMRLMFLILMFVLRTWIIMFVLYTYVCDDICDVYVISVMYMWYLLFVWME